MQSTKALLSQTRTPLIRFLGKRSTPTKIDHTPTPHPASTEPTLPNTFATYRQAAQQHGPLNTTLSHSHGAFGVGKLTGASLGPIEPEKGEYFDRSELGREYAKLAWTEAEIEAVESGGASMFQ